MTTTKHFTCHRSLEHWQIMEENSASVHSTESHEMPSHPCLQLSPLSSGLYVKTYPGTTSTSMRYHLGSVSTINGANWKNPDANKENPQGSSRQDLRHALCIRLEVSLVFLSFVLHFIQFLTSQKYDSVTVNIILYESPFQRANTLFKSHLETPN